MSATPHIATMALTGRLPKGQCRTCDKGAVRRKEINCRGPVPLNGDNAAAEFTRGLRSWARDSVVAAAMPKSVVA